MTTALRLLLALPLLLAPLGAEETANLLKNPSFEDGLTKAGVPVGWALYGALTDLRKLTETDQVHDGGKALILHDDDPAQELGIVQSVPAEGGKVYRAQVWIHGLPDSLAVGAHLQMRFLPSNEFHQVGFPPSRDDRWRLIKTTGLAPEGTKSITIYLYSHRDPKPRVILDEVSLVGGAQLEDEAVPAPVIPPITKLKDLRLNTPLVAGGQPTASLVAPASGRYAAQAKAIAQAVKDLTGVALPIVSDADPAAQVPLAGHLICLGNRSTNATISRLYDHYYTVLDLKYPGPGGYVVRSLHDPYGNGYNVLFAGGSDDAGVVAASEALVKRLRAARGRAGELAVGWTQEIKLSPAYTVPATLKEVPVWEASDGYGSSGYFGWNSISKRMALYYLTGDEQSAREALRLAFPDEATKKELADTDGEMIENKDDPLAGPYHYNAHMMVLYWDLIEESPVFTDAERLKVAQAFSRQLDHRKNEGIYGLSEPATAVGSRHGQWSAVSLYCLGRYLDKSYPDKVWRQCVRGAENHFKALHFSPWVAGENDNLYWYSTGIAPIFSYLVLTGDREPLDCGSVPTLLRGFEALINGQDKHWALRYASLGFLHKAAYVTGDGRWLTYRRRTEQNTDIFRLGQSFWPDDSLQPAQPTDLVDRWTIHQVPEGLWPSRGSGIPIEQSFMHGSYRNRVDGEGDFILLDGFNGASRNPYHCFAILELRLNGQSVLKAGTGAYLNQVRTKADGMVEPKVAMDAALRHADVLGETVTAVGEVPKMSFATWRRTLAQRVGRWALVADDLTFARDSANMEVETWWQPGSAIWDAKSQAVRVPVSERPPVPASWVRVKIADAAVRTNLTGDRVLIDIDPYGIKLLKTEEPGFFVEMTFKLDRPVTGQVYAELLNYRDRGVVEFQLDGRPVGQRYDHNTADVVSARVPLGERTLTAGEHTLRVTAVERHEGLKQMFVGLGGLTVQPAGAPEAEDASLTYEIRSSQVTPVTAGGGTACYTWRGPVKQGEHRIVFSLLAPAGTTADQATACLQLADNAAALALPEPAVAVVGERGAIAGELAIVSAEHLYGLNVTRAGAAQPVLIASAPVCVDWRYATGRLELTCDQEATVKLATAGQATVDGQPAGTTADGWLELKLAAGRHRIEGVKPRDDGAAALAAELATARGARAGLAAAAATPKLTGQPLAEVWTAGLGGRITNLVAAGQGAQRRLFASVDKTIHAFDAQGKPLGKVQTGGTIRVLHWWSKPGLLIAGCVDDKVIAYDLNGRQQWEFTSLMDPAVFRAAKQYWFKTAPGHEGIHGLFSGPFIDGAEQLFVGSACTLEILDGAGKLVKRMPVFWGPGMLFQLIDAPDGSRNLLVGRWPNGVHTAAIINSKTLDPNPRGFHGVPAGHDYVGGWSAQNRRHLLYADLDGDGAKEVVSEMNGTWNRVTVYDANGNAKANVNFGAGPGPGVWTVRDLDLLDLDGDGKSEILTALSDGLVLAYDHQCALRWSKRLPSPAAALVALKPGAPRLLVGCDDGQVATLDASGEPTQLGRIAGRPEKLLLLDDGTVALGSTTGELKVVRP